MGRHDITGTNGNASRSVRATRPYRRRSRVSGQVIDRNAPTPRMKQAPLPFTRTALGIVAAGVIAIAIAAPFASPATPAEADGSQGTVPVISNGQERGSDVSVQEDAPLDAYLDVDASTFDSMATVDERVELVGEIARADYRESGCLASITAAQMILESGVLSGETSGLAANYSNYFGIKGDPEDPSTWRNSTWTGETATLSTREMDGPTREIYVADAAFRAYPDLVTSVRDHSSYLAYSTWDGTNEIYPGYEEIRDYREAAYAISEHYATGQDYAEDLVTLIEKYDLTRFDVL